MDGRARAALALLLALAGCMHVRIEADGATAIDALGAVRVETHACPPEASIPTRICVRAQSGFLLQRAVPVERVPAAVR